MRNLIAAIVLVALLSACVDVDHMRAPAFSFMDGESGMAVYTNDQYDKISYRFWDGSEWDEPGDIWEADTGHTVEVLSMDMLSDRGIALWIVNDGSQNRPIKYATYDGSWTYQGEMENYVPHDDLVAALSVKYDHLGNPLATYSLFGEGDTGPRFSQYLDSEWTAPFTYPEGPDLFQTSLFRAQDGTIFSLTMDTEKFELTGDWQYGWSLWDGTEWSLRTEFGGE